MMDAQEWVRFADRCHGLRFSLLISAATASKERALTSAQSHVFWLLRADVG